MYDMFEMHRELPKVTVGQTSLNCSRAEWSAPELLGARWKLGFLFL